MKPTADPFHARAARVLFSISFFLQLPLPPYVLSGTAGPMLVELCILFASITPAFTASVPSVPCLKISWQATPLPYPRGSWPPRSVHLRAPLHPTNLPPRLASHALLLLCLAAFRPSIPPVPCRAASTPLARESPRLFGTHLPIVSLLAFFGFPGTSGSSDPVTPQPSKWFPTSFLHLSRFSLPPFLLPLWVTFLCLYSFRATAPSTHFLSSIIPSYPTFIPYYLLREE